MSLVHRANEVRHEHGSVGLWETAAHNLHRRLAGLSVLDPVCYTISEKRLAWRMAAEEDLDDILDTIGTYYHPRGRYRGFGKYRTLWAQQSRKEASAVARAAARVDPDTILEIGTLYGGTLYLWSRYLEPEETVISIDTDHRGKEAFFERFTAGLDAKLRCIEGSSMAEETLVRVEDTLSDPIDFLYIDGDHSYDGVKADFETYSRFLAEDGLVALHDIDDRTTGVPEFWSELEETYETRVVGDENGRSGLVYL